LDFFLLGLGLLLNDTDLVLGFLVLVIEFLDLGDLDLLLGQELFVLIFLSVDVSLESLSLGLVSLNLLLLHFHGKRNGKFLGLLSLLVNSLQILELLGSLGGGLHKRSWLGGIVSFLIFRFLLNSM